MSAKLTNPRPAADNSTGKAALRQLGDIQKDWNPARPAVVSDSVPATDSAEYIAVLAGQLQRIAETNGHDFLAYLIEMVVLEAWRIAGPEANRPDKKINSAGGSRV